jgi:hypothetical protein
VGIKEGETIMPKYVVVVNRTQKQSVTLEVHANMPWKAREEALRISKEEDVDFVTYESEYAVHGNPTYIRAEGLVNKFTPYWEKLNVVLKDLGYTLKISDTEDEPAHFSKGEFTNGDHRINIEIYLSVDGNDKGNIKITPTYPVYDFDHTDDPYQLSLRIDMAPRTYKARLTSFVSDFEKAHVTACAAQQELAAATKRAGEIADRINTELGRASYYPVKISANRWNKKIKFSVDAHVSDPEKLHRMTKILEEEGISSTA